MGDVTRQGRLRKEPVPASKNIAAIVSLLLVNSVTGQRPPQSQLAILYPTLRLQAGAAKLPVNSVYIDEPHNANRLLRYEGPASLIAFSTS